MLDIQWGLLRDHYVTNQWIKKTLCVILFTDFIGDKFGIETEI